MISSLADWPRSHYQHGGAAPFLFYVVFGCQLENLELSRSRHRCDAVPDGIEVFSCEPGQVDSFREGYLWDELGRADPSLAQVVAAQSSCVVIRGTVLDDASLNYFRNTLGLVQALLDSGGVAVFDPQGFRWWSRLAWTEEVFAPGQPLPHLHAIILSSEEEHGRQWLHTRGMRKFGRPDLSIHGVSVACREAAIAMLNRFIELQAFGGLIAEGQAIRMAPFPSGMVCAHAGDENDPDFNNSHVEIKWPATAELIEVLDAAAMYNDKGYIWAGHDAARQAATREGFQHALLAQLARIGADALPPALVDGIISGAASRDDLGRYADLARRQPTEA